MVRDGSRGKQAGGMCSPYLSGRIMMEPPSGDSCVKLPGGSTVCTETKKVKFKLARRGILNSFSGVLAKLG